MHHEGWRDRRIETHDGRAVERDLPETRLLQRSADNELAEIVVARIMAAELVGDAGNHDGGGKTPGRGDRPSGEIAAVAAARHAQPPRIDQTFGHAMVDAAQDVLELGTARITDIELG